MRAWFASMAALLPGLVDAASIEKLKGVPFQFLGEHCLECHEADVAKGKIVLDFLEVDWESEDQTALLERVHRVIAEGEMPPKKRDQPPAKDREAMLSWLDESLSTKVALGGTPLRRLNRLEYTHSIEKLFGIQFEVPAGFPPDTRLHGFDNQGAGLMLSAPLLEAYAESAALVADQLFPPPRREVASSETTITPKDMAISYSSGMRAGGAMRLGCKSDPVSRSCSWPTKFEAKGSGTYRFRIDASAFRPRDDRPMKLQVRARPVDGNDGISVSSLRLLGEFDVRAGSPQTFEFEADLYRGETLVYYYANAELDSDNGDRDEFRALLEKRFAKDPRLLAGWMAVEHNSGLRGGVGWQRVKTQLARDDLDLSKATVDSKEAQDVINKMVRNPVLYVETMIFEYFEEGPALEVRGTTIEGPLKYVEDPDTKAQKRRREQFLGERNKTSEKTWVEGAIRRFLTRAFRRPATDTQVSDYQQLFDQHRQEGHDFDAAMHLVVRTVLTSPHFLYRDRGEARLDDYEMASRLSYFLTGAPPDSKLLDAADRGRIANGEAFDFQANRLIDSSAFETFVTSFTHQWLGLHELVNIMPDPQLGRFRDSYRKAMEQEAEKFFTEMVRENRPLTDFIDPDFTFTSPEVGSQIYGLKYEKAEMKKGTQVKRVSLKRGGRHGGILGQAGVMMATANGVDTQPVLRGVWVLENVLGNPPPPPPEAVPAITPDTRGAKTVRDLMAAHTSNESCARCHQKIDPLGFVLENFDPLGQWRDNYNNPGSKKKGAPIDPTGTLPDGTPLKDVRDLKRYLVENIDAFAGCLAEKLFVYGTGRAPNYRERKQLEEVAHEILSRKGGTRDLMLGVLHTEAFRTK